MSADSIHHNVAYGGPPFTPGAGRATIKTNSKWVTFALSADTGKTFVWTVHARESGGVVLGAIKWYSGWRRYVFFPMDNCLFEPTCLRDIADFLDARMSDRKK